MCPESSKEEEEEEEEFLVSGNSGMNYIVTLALENGEVCRKRIRLNEF